MNKKKAFILLTGILLLSLTQLPEEIVARGWSDDLPFIRTIVLFLGVFISLVTITIIRK